MTTRTKMAVSFIAVVLGFFIMQASMGLFWKSERLGWDLIPLGIFVGFLYLFYFFLCSRRRVLLGLLITIGISIFIVAVSIFSSNDPASTIFNGWSLATIIRTIYYVVIFQVADYFGKPIHNKKQVEYIHKKLEEM